MNLPGERGFWGWNLPAPVPLFFVPQGGVAYTDFVKYLLREPDLGDVLDDFGLIRYSIGSNPRAAKRLASAYRLDEGVAEVDVEAGDIPASTKAERRAVLCLRAAYPTAYEHFLSSNMERGGDESDGSSLHLPGYDDFRALESFGEGTDTGAPLNGKWSRSKVLTSVFS